MSCTSIENNGIHNVSVAVGSESGGNRDGISNDSIGCASNMKVVGETISEGVEMMEHCTNRISDCERETRENFDNFDASNTSHTSKVSSNYKPNVTMDMDMASNLIKDTLNRPTELNDGHRRSMANATLETNEQSSKRSNSSSRTAAGSCSPSTTSPPSTSSSTLPEQTAARTDKRTVGRTLESSLSVNRPLASSVQLHSLLRPSYHRSYQSSISSACAPRKPSTFQSSRANTLWISCCVIFLVLIVIDPCVGFNLDTSNSLYFNSPQTGSYYGYSVAMLKRSASSKWLLFGAPRSSSRFLPNATRPGAIHKCELFEDVFSGHSCDEVQIDTKADGSDDSAWYDGMNRVFKHGRTDQWLGATIDVRPDTGIVTCASRWFNRRINNYHLMNGLCYEVPLDFLSQNIRKIPALIDAEKQTMILNGKSQFNYGFGSLGVSAHYPSGGDALLIGTPGLRSWSGGFISTSTSGSYISQFDENPTEISEMTGYAMTSGQYFGNGQTFYAIGSPRDKLMGKVYIFQSESTDFNIDKPFLTLDGSEVNGLSVIPINGFFGAALCSVDVNGDKMDDLIVGAPMFSKGQTYETGIVMVYLGQANHKFTLLRDSLTGNEAQGARFGSAMSSVGDLNSDGFNDIVVGAPYEDDLQGAIYIYNGCNSGVWPRYSQRIAGSDVRAGTMGFGISFSKPQDMNDDSVNDIAVGAYLSDSAFLLFGQSVINMNITMKTSVSQIDQATDNRCISPDGSTTVPCFSVDICFRYSYRQLPRISLNVTSVLDTYMGVFNRLAWQNGGLSTLNSLLTVFHNDDSCIGWNKVVIKSTADLVTPVRIQAMYTVLSYNTAGRLQPSINQFNGNAPEKPLLVAAKILEFKKDCPDNHCLTDLTVDAEASYANYQNYFIVGTSSLDLDLTITKTGHPSYSSNIFIAFPKSLQFQKAEKIYGDTEVSCGFLDEDQADDADGEEDTNSLEYLQRQLVPAKSDDEIMLACSFGNPLYNNSGVRFLLKMIVPESLTETQLTFRLNATTLSTETNPSDNTKSLTIALRNKVTTNFNGVSRPSYITVKNTASDYEMSHIYELRNQGPSPLPAAEIMVEFPQVQLNDGVQLRLNSTEWSCRAPCSIKCELPDVENVAPVVHNDNSGPSYNVDSSTNVGESRSLTSLRNVNCADDTCSRYECTLTDVPPRESAVVTLKYVASGSILETLNDGKSVSITSDASVRFGELDRLVSGVNMHFTDVTTDIQPLTPPKQQLAWWIILLSIIAGLLLIVIVVLILWKCGFFKRQKREEMRQMQHSGEVEKMLDDDADGIPDKS